MQCPRCQHENPLAARFCNSCGARFELTCSSCRHSNPAGSRFCNACGASIGATPTPAGRRLPSPETYIPKHLAENILTSRAALEGERKQVTVLFADLKGSTELLADRDPEEARKLLDPVIEHMMEAVHRYEGTVNQVMGDGIMALFGAPVAHEDHAIRACYAALRMQESVKSYAEVIFRSYGVPVEIRVGLNSGDVVVRAIGSDLHMDYTAVGQTTHLAARMEQMARPGSVLLAPDTLALVEGFVQVSSRGPVPVKGLREPMEIFELTGASVVRNRLHASSTRGLTRFVGRDSELELLRQALARAGQGQGQVVALVGEPAVGKSRLVWEFIHSHRSQGWLVLEAASVSYGKAITYFPVIELVRRYFQIDSRDDTRRVREKIMGKLLSLDRALEPTLAVFLSLLDVPGDDAEWEKLDPPQRRRRTLDAFKRLLVRESQVQPVLLVFEDLHWVDSETQALLDMLVDSVPTARLLLLVNYRPEYTHDWGNKTYYQQIRIDTLSTVNAAELLEALLGTDRGLAPLQRPLIERTAGNPFFLEEIVQALVETGMLEGERGSYRLARQIQTFQVPATVQIILAARMDRLAPEDKRLLQAAAVIGTEIPLTLLQAIADEPDEAVRHGIVRLQAAEFLYEARLFPDVEYTFKHALTHEVAYASLLHERRRALHRRIVDAIEELHSDRLSEHVERLSYHAVRGESWNKAVEYLGNAGDKIYTRSAASEAVGYYEQALAAVRQLPESRRTAEQMIDLHIAIRHPLAQLVESERMLDHLREAERLAIAIADDDRLGRVLAFMTYSSYQMGNYRAALECGARALQITTAPEIVGSASWFLAQTYLCQGRHERALSLYAQAIATTARVTTRVIHQGAMSRPAVVHGWWAVCLADMGRFSEAVARGEEALEIANRLGEPFGRAAAQYCLGAVWLDRGHAARAIALLLQALDICRDSNIVMYYHRVLAALGYGQVLSAQLREGLGILQEAVDHFHSRKIGSRFALVLAWQSKALLLAGRRDEALDVAHKALEAARLQGDRAGEATALGLDAEIAATGQAPDIAATVARYRDSLMLAAEIGMRPLVAHCHLGLGKLFRRTDTHELAYEHLTTATAMYREMDMRFWLEQAERQGREAL